MLALALVGTFLLGLLGVGQRFIALHVRRGSVTRSQALTIATVAIVLLFALFVSANAIRLLPGTRKQDADSSQ